MLNVKMKNSPVDVEAVVGAKNQTKTKTKKKKRNTHRDQRKLHRRKGENKISVGSIRTHRKVN